MRRYLVLFIYCLGITASNAQFVSSQSELEQALNNASAGSEIILKNQIWVDVIIDIDGTGSFAEPIIIRGETAGSTILEGNCDINLGGSYVVFRDVVIRNAYGLVSSGSRIDHLIEFEASNGNDCNNCTITNIKIDSYNGTESQSTDVFKWIYILGTNNEISYSSFVGKYGVGSIINDNRSNGEANYTKIHHNYFADRLPVGTFSELNDQDAIRLGTSTTSLSDSYSEVYDNYFYNFFGEIEIISNKSGQNKYYNNTFRNYSGTLTLRHGNNCQVFNNYFFAEKNYSSGGIRVIGEGHNIYNNYIEGVNSKKESGSTSGATGGINITNGRPDSELNGYFQVKDAKIVNNTLVNCDLGIRVGTKVKSDLTLPPENIEIANNIMLDSETSALSETTTPINSLYVGNITQNGTWDIVAGSNFNLISEANLLTPGDDFFRISDESLAIDAGIGNYDFLTQDILGGNRPVEYDAGAEEFGAGGTFLPYTGEDVGTNIGFGTLTGDLPDELISSLSNLEFTYQSSEINFNIFSNVEWEITSDIDWITVNPSTGAGSKIVTLNVLENSTSDIRSGKLTISQIGGGLETQVDISQGIDLFNSIEGSKIPIISVTAAGTEHPNIPENSYDGDETTRWSGESNDGSSYITYYLFNLFDIEAIRIQFHKGDQRTFDFKILANLGEKQVSTDLITSSGTTNDFETFILEPQLEGVEYLTISGYGNSGSDWNSYAEVEIYGQASSITTLLDEVSSSDLQVYPNPINFGNLILESQFKPLGEISIISMFGKEIYYTKTLNKSLEIDISEYSPGYYFVKSEWARIKRFIIVK